MDGNNAKDGIPSFKTMNSREQKLVDICFQLVLTATDRNFKKDFTRMNVVEKASWVAKQLRECGFDTEPCGSSWGVLK